MDAEKDLSETGYNLTGDKGIVVNFPMLGYIEGLPIVTLVSFHYLKRNKYS